MVDAGFRDKILAYYTFLDNYRAGKISDFKGLIPELISLGLLRDPNEIRGMISKCGLSVESLPEVVRDILFSLSDYVALYRFIEPPKVEYGCSVDELNVNDGLKNALKSYGINRLYRFQEEAIKRILNGEDIVIVAPTGSGKTECFAIPIIHLIASSRDRRFYPLVPEGLRVLRALFIYPTKSLSRDQLLKIRRLATPLGVTVRIFDGDTSTSEREEIYNNPPDILMTNFDIIHHHLSHRTPLSNHFKSVRYIVVDELHSYVGAFGANVHWILKRLQRVCGYTQMIGCSATISNPGEFASMLFDRRVGVVEGSGRRGGFHFIMLYPSIRSFYSAIGDVVSKLVKYGYKTIVFSNSHVEAEVVKQVLDDRNVKSYVHRAGLPKSYRVKVEEDFRSGRIMVVSATPTLELGIDVGDVDCVITSPIGLARFMHRIGRAGRRGQEAIAILMLRGGDPISAYYKRNPEKYFTYLEPIYVEPRNLMVARNQLIAACMDKPLSSDEFKGWADVLKSLTDEGFLSVRGKRYHATMEGRRILRKYNIRGAGGRVEIYFNGKIIGERELPIALSELFPGAVYLHAGLKFRSKNFKISGNYGYVEVERLPDDFQYRTDAKRTAYPEIIEVVEGGGAYGIEALYCRLRIREIVEGYYLRDIFSGEIISENSLVEPLEYSYETYGFVFKAPEPTTHSNSYKDYLEFLAGSFHAVEHVLIESSDMFTGSGSGEIGGISMGSSGVIFVYDGVLGGSGASLLLFKNLAEAFSKSYEILRSCDCNSVDGCPNCTYSYRCGNNNKPLNRVGAIEVFKLILSGAKTRVREEDYVAFKPIM
ncbi:DEAD/DEAH box helicase [Candidatus Culexarchaeum yellowstonense]|uniref:DEAD/DEAH box helicase n=1 Tax=Candidatus Culexarchaeum yellowstonense TaxID=2928963 RepID=UPI0026F17A1C|nr:DEAD/DEAH box helicase [Candidatus Culexarchaeum yellowstonense]